MKINSLFVDVRKCMCIVVCICWWQQSFQLGFPNEQSLGNVVVQTEYGKVVGRRVRGSIKGLKKDSLTDILDRFYGIPYAKPPVGRLRFSSPEPAEKWSEEKEAFEKAPSCPQSTFPEDFDRPYDKQTEDCLYLNVFTPYQAHNTSTTFPVILYIHGGSYESGSGHIYDGTVLSSLGVVVVTFNYRLGALGFLLSGDHHLAGNYGLEDQIMVMKWVQKNIRAFRGNPGNVMLVGHSVGAALVGIHLTIEENKGLFHSMVAQSGSASASYSLYHDNMGVNFKEYVFNVSATLGCGHDGKGGIDFGAIEYEGDGYDKRMKDVVECLREVPYSTFVNNRHYFPFFDKLSVEFRPYLDGKLIKRTIHDSVMQGNYHKVPFITGIVEREFDFFMEDSSNKTEANIIMELYLQKCFDDDKRIVDLLRFNYIDWPTTLGVDQDTYQSSKKDMKGFIAKENSPFAKGVIYYKNGQMLSDINMVVPTLQMADIMSKHSEMVYFYFFSEPQSYHSIELSYLFGTPFGADTADDQQLIHFKKNVSDKSAAKNLSRTIMRVWTYFAKHRKLPDVEGVKWPSYHSSSRRYLNFSLSGVKVFSHLEIEKTFLWNELVPNLFPTTSLNALGPGGSILEKYPSLIQESYKIVEKTNEKDGSILQNTLITLLVLATMLVFFLLLVLFKLNKKTKRLEKIAKLYSSENATNL